MYNMLYLVVQLNLREKTDHRHTDRHIYRSRLQFSACMLCNLTFTTYLLTVTNTHVHTHSYDA